MREHIRRHEMIRPHARDLAPPGRVCQGAAKDEVVLDVHEVRMEVGQQAVGVPPGEQGAALLGIRRRDGPDPTDRQAPPELFHEAMPGR
jgi:hypothetical protein